MGNLGLNATDEEIALQLMCAGYMASARIRNHGTNHTPGLAASRDAFRRSTHRIPHFVTPCGAPRGDYPGAVEAASGRAESEV